ncbi:unnamed protein product [Closterium sp. NIES-65]|nr:unnamed protein product [Closterium sp. NIES-65]
MPVRSIPRTRSLECPPGFAPAKRVSRPGKRRTRLAAAAVVSRASKRTPKTFAELLEEANLETLPPGTPSYLTAAVGPPTAASKTAISNSIMGALRHRFLLALVLVASLNFLAVFAAQPPPDGYYGASEPALEEAYDQRALLEAESDASLDSLDSVDLEDSRVLLSMGDAAADLKQTSDDLSGSVKKAVGQAGRNVRNSIGSMVGVPPNKGTKKHHRRGGKKTGRRGGKKTGRRGGKKTGLAGARKRKSGAAAPKTSAAGVPKKQGAGGKLNSGATPKKPAAAAAGATGAPKKQEAGAKDTSGAAPESPAAPAAANEPRALLEAADSDAVIDSVDSVDFDSVDLEDSRVLLSMGDAAADLKQTSDDLSGSVKKAVGQAGRNVRNSIGSMVGVPPNKGKKKHHRRGGKKAGRRGGKKTGPAGARKRNSGAAALKTAAAPGAAGGKAVSKNQAGGKLNSGAHALGAKGTSGTAPKPTAASSAASSAAPSI